MKELKKLLKKNKFGKYEMVMISSMVNKIWINMVSR